MNSGASYNKKYQIFIPFAYSIYLFLAWACYVAYLYPEIKIIDGILGEITEEVIRAIIFLSPLYFIHKVVRPLSLKNMGVRNNLSQDIKLGFISSAILLLIGLPLTLYVAGKSISLDGVFMVSSLSTIFTGVIIEEIVFRGYLLSSLEKYGRALAVAITVLLFVLIHYPGWWLLETHSTIGGWIQASGGIFLLGIILSIVFLRYKSLLACIMIHSTNNLISLVAV